jgi:peptidoglycan/LPS O-acetylase OafA/YrhL
MSCACCKSVNTICFWGPRRPARWKRPVLFVLSLVAVVGLSALIWTFKARPDALFFNGLAAIFVLAGLLSVVVAVRGCDACVARLLGEF